MSRPFASVDAFAAPRPRSSVLRLLASTAVMVAAAVVAASVPTAPAGAAVAPGVKPAITGLLDRKGFPAAGAIAHLGGYVVNVNWRDLQATRGAALPASNAIDNAIAQIRTRAPHLSLKVRVFAGLYAPEWAKNLTGPPVQMYEPVDGGSGSIGRWWSPEYQGAYADVMAKLAARYDSVPEIREWAISGAMTFYAEPFLRQVRDPRNGPALFAAGYTAEADKAAIKASVDAHRVFTTTRSSLALNAFQYFKADGSIGTDNVFTTHMMDYTRSLLGVRGVLENNSLGSPLKSGMDSLYAAITARGPSITYQTETPVKVGSLAGTLQWAVDHGATAVELPGAYPYHGDDTLTDAQMDAFNAALRANAGETNTAPSDTAAATTTLTSPAHGASVAAGRVRVAGSAGDDTGVAAVKVAVKNNATGQWLQADGTWGAYVAHNAALAAPGATATGWSFDWNATGAGSYTATATAADASANADASPATVTFSTYLPDTTPADTTVTKPAKGASLPAGGVTVAGSAADDVGVKAVKVAVRNDSNGQWLRADGSWGSYQALDAVLSASGAASTGWSFNWSIPGAGSYTATATAFDTSGNADATPSTTSFSGRSSGGLLFL